MVLPLGCEISDEQRDCIPRMNAMLGDAVPSAEVLPESLCQGLPPMQAIVGFALYWTHEFQRAGGVPVFEQGRILGRRPKGDRSFWVAIPTLEGAFSAATLTLGGLLGVMNAAFRGENAQEQLTALTSAIKNLENLVPKASNVPRFLRAAFELEIPYSLVAGTVFQFGQGACARWLDSTFTDETPQLAAALARKKQHCARVLRRAGIPVPNHFVVKDGEEAVRRAEELGYPVVIKPADQDGGVGVAAGLRTAEHVSSAFAAARKYSATIIVEKHFEGRDYRLVVFRGDMIWAIERIPGGVTGDGVQTVCGLIDQLNADPRRGEGPHAPLKLLVIDDEARGLLADSALTLESVPDSGRFVCLRRAANVTRGGTAEAVFDQVHPDNRRLAIRAAAALRLDLAGIDLLIPDIRRSWFGTGAAICEVNGQPYLGSRWAFMYKDILRQLLVDNGRIPIAVVLGAPPDGRLASCIAEKLVDSGLVAGWSDRNGATIGAARVAQGPLSSFAGGHILMRDRTVKAAILCVNDADVLRSGLPFDRFDVFVVAGQSFSARSGVPLANSSMVIRNLIQALQPACQGKMFLTPDVGEATHKNPPQFQIVDAGSLASVVCQEMLEASARHRASGVSGSSRAMISQANL